MVDDKTYTHEIIFAVVGVVVAFLFNNFKIFLQFLQVKLSFGLVINYLIYLCASILLVPLACFLSYIILASLVKMESAPDERKLTFRHFSLLSAIIVTTLILEESYSTVKSILVIVSVLALPLLYKFYRKFYDFYYYHFTQ
jgi:hypothetical protein